MDIFSYDDEIYGRADAGLFNGDFYFSTASSSLELFAQPCPEEPQDQQLLPPKDDDSAFNSFLLENLPMPLYAQEDHAVNHKKPLKIYKKISDSSLPQEYNGLKRGPKYMNDEEKKISKNNFIKLYQDIWRLLFRKNSTFPLSTWGKQCCSYYNNKTFDNCPSGKSHINDLFRTIEHIWKVIEFSRDINPTYALKQFIYMKMLLPWKLQPRFTDCPSRPDIEPLENDRVYQNGKKRNFLKDLQIDLKFEEKNRSKLENETIVLQKKYLWDLLNNEEVFLTVDAFDMETIYKYLGNLFTPQDDFITAFQNNEFSWPMDAKLVNLEQGGLVGKTFTAAKILIYFGSLARKRAVKYSQLDAPKIAQSYEESLITFNFI
jgi:hypothetical protein